jgi:hypothetical protein
MDLITKNNEIFTSFLERVDEIDRALDGVIQNYRPLLNGEKYITDKELSKIITVR